MRLESVTLRGWRRYREERSFRFEPGVNVLHGPNESGKSTLLEALVRGLFDRHTSKTRDLKAIVPVGSTLAPEVELVLAVDGGRWKARKRFLREPVAELWSEVGGRWQLDHEGDRADRMLRDLLRGEGTRGGARPEHRGLAQALWYLQGPVGRLAELYGSSFHIAGLGLMGSLNLVMIGGLLGLAGAWLAVSRHLARIEPR